MRARDAAQSASRAKSEFLANMSHEIRTPLNGVLGMAQVMARHPLSPDQTERLNVIRAGGESLLSVLNAVLDISKIESGRLDLEQRPFDLADAVHAACDAFAAQARQKDLALRLFLLFDQQRAFARQRRLQIGSQGIDLLLTPADPEQTQRGPSNHRFRRGHRHK